MTTATAYSQALYDLYDAFRDALKDSPVTFEEADRQLDEEDPDVGCHTAPALLIRRGELEIARLEPVAAAVIGARGRADLHGMFDVVAMLLLDAGGPTITMTLDGGDETVRPVYSSATSAGWYFQIGRDVEMVTAESVLRILSEISEV